MVTNKLGCYKNLNVGLHTGIVLYLHLSNSHFHKQNQEISIGNCMATYVTLVQHILITLDPMYN